MNNVNQPILIALNDKLNCWSNGNGQFPVLEIIAAYHQVGKHFVSEELHLILRNVRDLLLPDLSNENKWIKQLMNMLLDKYDDMYDYRSYLGLELLGLPEFYEQNEFCTAHELDRRKLLLGYDIINFELSAFNGQETWLPLRPASKELVINRCHRVLEVIKYPLQRLNITNQSKFDGDIIKQSQALCQTIRQGMHAEESLQLKYTIVPVYKIHDEYMFIRVLQSFETIFTWIAITLRSAIRIGESNVSQVVGLIKGCTLHILEAFPLFTLLATINPEAFKEFRVYTEGASAIQSRSYKQIESLCRRPDQERLDSIAYHSVPEVRNSVLNSQSTIEDIYGQIIASENESEETKNALSAALKNFETELHRWRMMHYGLASRILGSSATSGTGYTVGPPYLKDASKIPLFKIVL